MQVVNDKPWKELNARDEEMTYLFWLRGHDLNMRPLGYEPNELPGCSTPHMYGNNQLKRRQSPHGHQSA